MWKGTHSNGQKIIVWVVMVLAVCVHHAYLQRRGHEARGVTEGTKEQTPPPTHRAGPRGNKAANRGRANGQGAGPSPADECHATCSHRARNVHGLEERATRTPQPPHPPPPPHSSQKKRANQHGAARPPQGLPGRGRGRQGDGNERQATWGGGTQGRPQGQRAGRATSSACKKQARATPTLARTQEPILPVRGRAEGESEGQAGQGRSPGVQKGVREGGKNEGGERKGRGQHSGRGGSERREPTGEAGEGPSLRGLPPPPPGDRIGPT